MVPNNITLLISHENWDISSQVTKTHHSIPVITLININSVTFSDEFKSMSSISNNCHRIGKTITG